MMDRDALGAGIAKALVEASKRDAPDGYPASPGSLRVTQADPSADLEIDYELEPTSMPPWMAKVIGDGVAAGVVAHLRSSLSVTSSVAVEGMKFKTGSEVSTGADIPVNLDFQPQLVLLYTTVTVTLVVAFTGMEFPAKIKAAGNTFGLTYVNLGTNKFTIKTDADVNPAGGGSTVYWLAVGGQHAINARGASVEVK